MGSGLSRRGADLCSKHPETPLLTGGLVPLSADSVSTGSPPEGASESVPLPGASGGSHCLLDPGPCSGDASPSPSPAGIRQVRLSHRGACLSPNLTCSRARGEPPLGVLESDVGFTLVSLSPASIRGWGSLVRTPVLYPVFSKLGR